MLKDALFVTCNQPALCVGSASPKSKTTLLTEFSILDMPVCVVPDVAGSPSAPSTDNLSPGAAVPIPTLFVK